MATKAFPKTVYVKWEYSGDDEPFLVADDDPATHAEINDNVRVGVYELKKLATVTANAEVA